MTDSTKGFSWPHGPSLVAFGSPRQLPVASRLSRKKAYQLGRSSSNAAPGLPQSVTPGLNTDHRYGTINPLSIAYGYYALGLGPTNPTWIHLPSETLGFRRTRFSRAFYATHTGIRTSGSSSQGHPCAFLAPERSPTSRPSRGLPHPHGRGGPRSGRDHGFGAALEPRWIVGAGSLDQ